MKYAALTLSIAITTITHYTTAAWSDVVLWEGNDGWQYVDVNWAWDSKSDWIWIQDAQVWVYVLDPNSIQHPTPPANMVFVKGGTLPQISTLGELDVPSFFIGKYEVTFEEWEAVYNWAVLNGYYFNGVAEGCSSNHPVHSINWYDALKWCNARSEMEGLNPVYTDQGQTYKTGEGDSTIWIPEINLSADGYRLPTEMEWEFAARGGNQGAGYYLYSGSMTLGEVGWYYDNSSNASCNLSYNFPNNGNGTWPVGSKAPNELGIYDMSGNISEWCWDQSSNLVVRFRRGGSWYSGSDEAKVTSRVTWNSGVRFKYVGFRVVRSIE